MQCENREPYRVCMHISVLFPIQTRLQALPSNALIFLSSPLFCTICYFGVVVVVSAFVGHAPFLSPLKNSVVESLPHGTPCESCRYPQILITSRGMVDFLGDCMVFKVSFGHHNILIHILYASQLIVTFRLSSSINQDQPAVFYIIVYALLPAHQSS